MVSHICIETSVSVITIVFLWRKTKLDFSTTINSTLPVKNLLDVVADVVTRSATCSTGFVTFKDLATVTCATTAPLCHDPDLMIASVAPHSQDILWENIHINMTWSRGRELTANLFLSIGAILWSVPVASIQAIANIDSLGKPNMIFSNIDIYYTSKDKISILFHSQKLQNS